MNMQGSERGNSPHPNPPPHAGEGKEVQAGRGGADAGALRESGHIVRKGAGLGDFLKVSLDSDPRRMAGARV